MTPKVRKHSQVRRILLAAFSLLLTAGCGSGNWTRDTYQLRLAPEDFVAGPDLPTVTKQLIDLNEVQTDGIGDDGAKSVFRKLKLVFKAKGDGAYFRKMLTDGNVVVRAMAMTCLAETEGPAAVPSLRSRLWSRTVFRFQGGCITANVTEGYYAWFLLTFPELVKLVPGPDGPVEKKIPALLSLADRLSLDLEVLSRNAAADIHVEAGEVILDAFEGPKTDGSSIFGNIVRDKSQALSLAWPTLNLLRSQLTNAQVIKALARAGNSPTIKAFLIKCVGDAGLSTDARLAAASGLTRYADADAEKALLANRDALNALSADVGTTIWQTFQTRKKLVKLSEMFDSVDGHREENEILFFSAADHPMCVRQVYSMTNGWNVVAQTKHGNAFAQAMLAIADQFAANTQPWNTYGGEVYYLDFRLRDEEACGNDDRRMKALAGKPREPHPSEHGLFDPAMLTKQTIPGILGQAGYRQLVGKINAAIDIDSKQKFDDEPVETSNIGEVE